MKYILILMLTTGSAPVTPEHWMLTTAEFDDEAACQSAALKLQRSAKRTSVNAMCVPKGSAPSESKTQAPG